MSLIFRAGKSLRYPQVQALASCENVQLSSATGTRTSSSFGDFPGSSSVSFTKYDDDSRLRVDLHVVCYSTAVSTRVEFAVRISSVDYIAASLNLNIANAHRQCSGVVLIPGIAAGTYTVQPRWRRVSGAGTLTTNGDDYMSMTVSECQE